jgi:NADH:ubiquinone oxidoreductase subunit F (NADH-binding)/NADH:ubiquinone oxidoreductase subunit E
MVVPVREPRGLAPLAHRLRQFQRRHGRFVSDEDLASLSKALPAPLAQLNSTASFFEEFREPDAISKERHCGDPACAIAGGFPTLGKESTMACHGRCDQGPVRMAASGELHAAAESVERRVRNLAPEPFLSAPSLERVAETALATLRRESDPAGAIQSRLREVADLERHRQKRERSLVQRWRDAADTGSDDQQQRFIVCHADAGNPGTIANAWLLQHRPRAVIDGMAIAAVAVGANEGVICVPHDLPEVFSAVDQTIREVTESGRFKDSGFEISAIATFGSHVGGEETALLNAIEGLRGEARLRPPEPEVAGIFGLPTVVELAEIFALLPGWLINGRDPGTRLVTVTPPLAQPGLVEIDASISLRGLLREAAGGEIDETACKALLLGGPFGSIIFSKDWDLRLDAEVLASQDLATGHWGLTPIPAGASLRNLAKTWLDFAARESCGKCSPCQLGPLAARQMMNSPEGDSQQRFCEILDTIMQTSLCGFGRDFPRPLRQLIDHYGIDRLFAEPEG